MDLWISERPYNVERDDMRLLSSLYNPVFVECNLGTWHFVICKSSPLNLRDLIMSPPSRLSMTYKGLAIPSCACWCRHSCKSRVSDPGRLKAWENQLICNCALGDPRWRDSSKIDPDQWVMEGLSMNPHLTVQLMASQPKGDQKQQGWLC